MLTSPYERKNYKQKSFYVLLSCLWVNVSRYAYRCLGTDARSLLRILASDSISAITPKGNIGKKGKDKAVPIPIPERLPEPTTKAAGDSIPLRTLRKRKRLLSLPSRKKVDLIEFHININEVLYSKRFAGFKRLHVSLVCLLFFLGLSSHSRIFFTHMETSALPAKGCKFWLLLGTYGHWAVRVL